MSNKSESKTILYRDALLRIAGYRRTLPDGQPNPTYMLERAAWGRLAVFAERALAAGGDLPQEWSVQALNGDTGNE